MKKQNFRKFLSVTMMLCLLFSMIITAALPVSASSEDVISIWFESSGEFYPDEPEHVYVDFLFDVNAEYEVSSISIGLDSIPSEDINFVSFSNYPSGGPIPNCSMSGTTATFSPALTPESYRGWIDFHFPMESTTLSGTIAINGGEQIIPFSKQMREEPEPVAPAITTDSLPDGKVNESYSTTIEATGDTPISFSVSDGTLPDGLVLTEAGEITGTPEVAGTFNFEITASNDGGSDIKDYSITVTAADPPEPVKPPEIIEANLPQGKVGDTYKGTITALGEDITWSYTGDLPEGLTFTDGSLTGKPTTAGIFEFTVTATNSGGEDTVDCSITIIEAATDPTDPTEEPTEPTEDPTDPTKPTEDPVDPTETEPTKTTIASSNNDKGKGVVNTGDTSQSIGVYLILIAAAFIGLFITGVIRKKRYPND